MAEEPRVPVRRAGRAILAEGQVLLWSVAGGARGRRWRASTRQRGAEGLLLDDLLLEVETGGRLARLELTTPAGQLTFHAEPDEREAHGNAVTADGMRHFALCWAPGRGVEIPWSPIADAVLAGTPADSAGSGGSLGSGQRVVARIGPDLVPSIATITVAPAGDGRWLIGAREIRIDGDGVPVLPGGVVWPLEEAGLAPS